MFQQRSFLPLAIVCAFFTVALFFSYQQPRIVLRAFEQFLVAPQGLDIAKRLMKPPAEKSTRQIYNVMQSNARETKRDKWGYKIIIWKKGQIIV